jgi:hypothetical protein
LADLGVMPVQVGRQPTMEPAACTRPGTAMPIAVTPRSGPSCRRIC